MIYVGKRISETILMDMRFYEIFSKHSLKSLELLENDIMGIKFPNGHHK